MSFECIDEECTTPGAGYKGRGLCLYCYDRHRADDTLLDFPRKIWHRDDLLCEWEHFVKDRDTHRKNVMAFAEHLGRPFPSVERSLTRAGVRAARPVNAPTRRYAS